MDRCALFVDAGYLLADGAMAVHGTRRRDAVSWDYPHLLELLGDLAARHAELPVLRCYWYEATPEGRRSPEHDALADIPGLKLRLGRVRSGGREGVELMAYRDLTTLAREHAISDAVIVSGDDDMINAVADAQDFGVRVTGVHVAVGGNWTISRALRQECDDLIELEPGKLRPHVTLEQEGAPVSSLTNGQAHSGAVPGHPQAAANGTGRTRHPSSGHSGPQPVAPTSSGQHRRRRTGPNLAVGHPSGPTHMPEGFGSQSASAQSGRAANSDGAEGSERDSRSADRANGDGQADRPAQPEASQASEASAPPTGRRHRQHEHRNGESSGHRSRPGEGSDEPNGGAAQAWGQSSREDAAGEQAGDEASGRRKPQGRADRPGEQAEGNHHQGDHHEQYIWPAPYNTQAPQGQQGQARPDASWSGPPQSPYPQPGQVPPPGQPPAGFHPPQTAQPPGPYDQPWSGWPQPERPRSAPYENPSGHDQARPAEQDQQPVSGGPTLSEAVRAAHTEGRDFGDSVARDAPALWLEAVVARKPRMPSDLEARLLQGSTLPIDFLLHDEVRHALRRGFWEALEQSRRS